MRTGALTILRDTVRYVRRGDVPWRRLWTATYESLVGSLVLVSVVVGLVGASLCWQSAWQACWVLGDQSFIGSEYLAIMVNEFAPLMVGTMLVARGGAGLAARLATRKAMFQLDAVRLLGDDLVWLLVVPEILGAFITSAILAPPAMLAGEVAGMITMKLAFAVEPASFLALEAVHAGDLWFLLLKMVVFGVVVTVMGARAGLRVRGDLVGVGQAATAGVVHGLVAVLVLDAVMDALRAVVEHPFY